MQILVNPRQTNKIILESSFKDMSNGIKKSYELVKDVLTKTGEQINMNLSFLFISNYNFLFIIYYYYIRVTLTHPAHSFFYSHLIALNYYMFLIVS